MLISSVSHPRTVNADPEDRKAVYSKLNLAVVCHDDGRMQVSAGPDACTNECVGGGMQPLTLAGLSPIGSASQPERGSYRADSTAGAGYPLV